MGSTAQNLLLGSTTGRAKFNRNGNVEDALVDLRGRITALLNKYDDQTGLGLTPYTPTISTGAGNLVLGASGAAFTVAGGIKVPFQWVNGSSTVIDTDNDPNYTLQGTPAGRLLVSSGDVARGDLLTGGLSQGARWVPRVGFRFVGQKFGIYVRTLANPLTLQVWVNGQPIAVAPTQLAVGVPERRYVEIDLGSIDSRLIEYAIDGTNAEINGVAIGPNDSIRRGPDRFRLAVLGDSIAAGALGVGQSQVWPDRLAARLGVQNWRLAIGGTGFSTLTGTSSFIDRVQDCVDAQPDFLIVAGGQNDLGQSQSAMQTFATTLLTTLQTKMPNTILMLLGCHVVSEQQSAGRRAVDDGLRAAALACNVPFMSPMDPYNQYATAPDWRISTAYSIGNVVRETTTFRCTLVCHTAHTSASSGLPDMTKFYAQSLFTGTGKVGSTTGRGSADVCIQSDGIHPTVQGHMVYETAITQWVLGVLRSIAVL